MTIGPILIRDKSVEIRRFALEYGAANVSVTGSVARGEDREESDIDLLVGFEPGRSLMDHSGRQLAVEELQGSKVEVASIEGLHQERARGAMKSFDLNYKSKVNAAPGGGRSR